MIWRFLTGLVMRLLRPIVIYWKGRSDARREAQKRDAEAYRDVRKEIDDAMAGMPRDPVASREWLRERMRKHKSGGDL